MILRNSLRCPDGTELISRNRHDYVTHKDANGNIYMVDGGLEYIRRSANGDEVDTSVIVTDHKDPLVREHLAWGTYGPDGEGPLKYVVPKDMETSHIEAILRTHNNLHWFYREAYLHELQQRPDRTIVDEPLLEGK